MRRVRLALLPLAVLLAAACGQEDPVGVAPTEGRPVYDGAATTSQEGTVTTGSNGGETTSEPSSSGQGTSTFGSGH